MEHSTRRSKRAVIGSATLVVALLAGALGTSGAAPASGIKSTRSVMLAQGRSTILHFDRMRRVEVIEPDLVEVVVASLSELSLYGKRGGDTTVYVWDRLGIHQLEVTITGENAAVNLIADLRRLLGPRLTYTSSGERTVIIEGTLPPEEVQRARSILEAFAKGEVQVVDLIRGEGDAGSKATALAAALRKVLGERLQYTVWNNDTLLVQGGLGDQTELERARRLLAAAGNQGINVVDLLEVQEGVGEAPLEAIATAIGKQFRVWQIQGKTVGIEGAVSSASELADLNRILEAFSRQAKVVNLVRVVEPRPDINEMVAMLQRMMGPACTVRSLNGETISVEGIAGSADELKRLRDVMTKFPTSYQVVDLLHVGLPDKRQVLCHVRVVDVNKSDLKRMGINWGQIAITSENEVSFVDQPWLIQNLPSGVTSGGENGLENVFPIGAQIDALAEKDHARILSEPNVLVDDGGKATIHVGGEIPLPIAQPGGGGVSSVTVEWKQYGVLLDVEPTILEGGRRINLKVSPEVSSLDFGNAVTISGFTLPAMRSRRAETQVTVSDGDTLVLAGLLQQEDTRTLNKIPLLADLPIIGQLFRHKEFQKGESELVIMVTPEIKDKTAQQFR